MTTYRAPVIRWQQSIMKRLRSSHGLPFVCMLLLYLVGCGSNPSPSTPVTPPVPSVSPLAGNWLITGSLPAFGLPLPSAFGLAMTFDVVGDQITARESDSVPCPNGGDIGGAGGTSSGTLASSGSFSIQSLAPPAGVTSPITPSSLQITGTAPTAVQGGWSGTYSYTPGSTTCGGTLMGSFTATPIQTVVGTYSGSTILTKLPSGSAPVTPVTLKITTQQGTTVTPTTGSAYYKASALTGDISVTGSSCFTHGTITSVNGVPSASVAGNFVTMGFKMDDGSLLTVSASLTKADASILRTQLFTIRGGDCDGQLSATPFDISR